MCVTALAAFAVTIIFRTSTTANFAQGAIAAFGCYIVADLLNKYGIPVWIGVFAGVLAGVVIGVFIDLLVFRRGRHVNELGKQIITMGFVSLFFGGIPLVFGTPERIPFEAFYNTVKAGISPNFVIPALGGEIVITKHAVICLAITAVVLGGANIYGGSGSIIGTAIAVLLVGYLQQGLQMAGVPNQVSSALSGALLIVVVVGRSVSLHRQQIKEWLARRANNPLP